MSLSRIFVLFVIVLFASCKCDESQSCDGLSGEGQNIMPQELFKSVYKTAGDSIINIYSRSSRIQGSTEEDCKSSGGGKCDCPDCPDKSGRIHYALAPIHSESPIVTRINAGTLYKGVFYPNDTVFNEILIRNEEFYVTTIDETSSSSNPSFQVDFLGFSYIFNVEKVNNEYTLVSNAQNSEIELLTLFSTPEKTYNNLLVLNNQASRFTEKSDYLNKLYYSTNEGVVAFESKDGQLFYLADK
ncbi:MAG: hypothetical protein JKY48_07765 [Flavobacteriales bacterium]|nr:hypothetical protein [Flavobacteriales bacterium]